MCRNWLLPKNHRVKVVIYTDFKIWRHYRQMSEDVLDWENGGQPVVTCLKKVSLKKNSTLCDAKTSFLWLLQTTFS